MGILILLLLRCHPAAPFSFTFNFLRLALRHAAAQDCLPGSRSRLAAFYNKTIRIDHQ